MKKIIQLFAMALILVVSVASCTQDQVNSITQTQVTNSLQSGNWRITYYMDNNVVETSNYTGYSFTFNSNNTAQATKNGANTAGSWSIGNDDSKVKLILNFGTSSPLDELTEDWRVLEVTDTKIRLEHISGGNGGTDFCTFEK